jgi:hypothetical protein
LVEIPNIMQTNKSNAEKGTGSEPAKLTIEGESAATPDVPKLTPVQQTALARLAEGNSISEAARSIGIDRRSVHRWLREDADFAAAYNAWQQELLDSGRARVLAMSDLALTTIRNAIEKGDSRTALRVADKIGLLTPARIHSTDADRLSRLHKLRDHRSQITLEKAEEKLRRESGEDEMAWLKDVESVEDEIDWLLQKRDEALAGETPEQREERLSQAHYRSPLEPRTVLAFRAMDAGAEPASPAPALPVVPATSPPTLAFPVQASLPSRAPTPASPITLVKALSVPRSQRPASPAAAAVESKRLPSPVVSYTPDDKWIDLMRE